MAQPSSNAQTNNKQKSEKELFEQRYKEKENQAREQRLEEHRRYLHEQMLIRQDYYSLGLIHKAIILVLFITLSAFVAFLVLSYFPPTKDFIHDLIHSVI